MAVILIVDDNADARWVLTQLIGPDRHGNQVRRIGATVGHGGEVGTEETRAGRWEEGDVQVGGQRLSRQPI